MKKYALLALSGLLALSLASCGGGAEGTDSSISVLSSDAFASEETTSQAGVDVTDSADGFALYQTAVAGLAEQVENGSFRCGYSVENDSGAYTIATTGVMAVSHADGFRFSNQTATETGLASLASDWYCDGAHVYTAVDGVTRKQALNADAEERLGRLIRSYSYGLIDPADAAAESQSVTQTEEGYTVQLTLDGETLTSISENFSDVFGSPYQAASMDITAEITEDSQLSGVTATAEVAGSADGQVMSFTMTIRLTFSDLGADLDITPADTISLTDAQTVDSLWS